ncbi:Uu.00g013610.m01.CDS01 [Anthostomella pinea]|uniref:Uu.00g013610.m01.CDS01 n=1 Tax=Anthostomella pinea TaxID=933095 RepID=A0AAI8VY81_9PEZI|nr:Uu.00g013610.m01.CDS01 [Anthostomella pinea]
MEAFVITDVWDADLRFRALPGAQQQPVLPPCVPTAAHREDVRGWQEHVEKEGLTDAFQPLRYTEGKRYEGIIKESKKREKRVDKEIRRTRKLVSEAIEALTQTLTRRPRGRPPKNSRPKDAQVASQPSLRRPTRQESRTMQALEEALKEVKWYKAKNAPRHQRQRPEMCRLDFPTPCGTVQACTRVHDGYWYGGHRPGTPIFRCIEIPQPRGPETKIVFKYPSILDGYSNFLEKHPNLLDKYPDLFEKYPNFFYEKDADLFERFTDYKLRFEGIVPFDRGEMSVRFYDHALPNLLVMVVAMLGYDSCHHSQGLDRVREVVEKTKAMLKLDLMELTNPEVGQLWVCLKELQESWVMLYYRSGNQSRLPRYLRDQINDSISRFWEMGWLITQLGRTGTKIPFCRFMVLHACAGLLQAVTGRNVKTLCDAYFAKLSEEGCEQYADGERDDVLIYKSDKPLTKHEAVLGDLYHPDGPPPLPSYLLERLKHSRTLARSVLPEQPARAEPEPSSPGPTAAADADTIVVASSSTPATPEATKNSRKRPAVDIEERLDESTHQPQPEQAKKQAGTTTGSQTAGPPLTTKKLRATKQTTNNQNPGPSHPPAPN